MLLCGWLLALGSVRAQVESPEIVNLTLGMSTQGRPIEAVRIGNGPRKFVLVGNTHGGPERNTYQLSLALIEYFRAHPEDVPPDVRLYIIPSLNPDGLASGTRQNANGVDLNRNMDTNLDGCLDNDWRQRVAGAYGIISDIGGPYAESEVESRLICNFLLDASGVIFFHTSGAVVFPACNHAPSTALAQAFAEAADYRFIPEWDRYLITGGMHDWAGALGIAAITPELTTGSRVDADQNLAGVLAILRDAHSLLVLPEPHVVDDIDVHPVIWRAWQAWGGQALYGRPLRPATETRDGWTKLFERASFTYRPARSDTSTVVQLDAIDQHRFQRQATLPPHGTAVPRSAYFVDDTEPLVRGVFAEFWEMRGGAAVFGRPLGDEEEVPRGRETRTVQQVFERVVLQRPVSAGSLADVSLAPLGRMQWALDDAHSPETQVVPR